MIKRFSEYVLPEMFNNHISNWHEIDASSIINDLYILIKKNGLENDIILSGDYQFHEEEDVLDAEFFLEESYKGFYGNLYVTWQKDSGWPCTHFWFDGFDEDDVNHIHEEWENE